MHFFEMIEVYNAIVILFFMAFVTTGSCQGNNEETRAGSEYMQIFRNIPALFEYLLDLLEKRVEILESNDITVFQKSSENCFGNDECINNEVKREINQYLTEKENSVDHQESEVKINVNDAYSYYGGNKYKRETRLEAMDSAYTTEIHEYGRSSGQNPTKKSFDVSEVPKANDVRKREVIKREFIDIPFSKRLADMNNLIAKSLANKKTKVKCNRFKRNYPDLGKEIFGPNWSIFNVSPEEVEEKAIRTEQMIEDYNAKNRKNKK